MSTHVVVLDTKKPASQMQESFLWACAGFCIERSKRHGAMD